MMGLTTDRDYVRENTRDLRPLQTHMESPQRMPDLQSHSFGKVPSYLKRMKGGVTQELEFSGPVSPMQVWGERGWQGK